ncbi:hypothetical protein OIU74_015514 [Salix koriyanagi]|uniref:Uncharacterized protein n=1 Tax=Salix koriyanagi TaxID=2511006 RepID=A0A9Q0PMG8_9ROSI|nr:hypothetical protein OIU74_015514 [Salix koriyanagi]
MVTLSWEPFFPVYNELITLLFPLTLPSVRPRADTDGDHGTIFKTVPKIFSLLLNTASDFLGSLMKSSLVDDDLSSIRSGDVGIEFRPVAFTTMTFSLCQIKQIKATLGVVSLLSSTN